MHRSYRKKIYASTKNTEPFRVYRTFGTLPIFSAKLETIFKNTVEYELNISLFWSSHPSKTNITSTDDYVGPNNPIFNIRSRKLQLFHIIHVKSLGSNKE